MKRRKRKNRNNVTPHQKSQLVKLRRKSHLLTRLLQKEYGSPSHNNKADPLDELIFIILSLMTTSPSFNRVYDRLAKACGTWQALLDMPMRRLKIIIKDAGLSNQKGSRLKLILKRIKTDFGKLSLERLRGMTDDEAKKYLTSLPGVGVKAAKCIMMYSLNRQVLPVDTHIWRISQRLGLVPLNVSYSKVHSILEEVVKPADRYAYHVNVLAHGQKICLSAHPRCNDCVLRRSCLYPKPNK